MAEMFRKDTHPLWRAFAIVYLLGAAGLDFYWLFTESGPVVFLAEFQAEHLFSGSWYPKVTLLVLLLIELLPLLALKLIVDRTLLKNWIASR